MRGKSTSLNSDFWISKWNSRGIAKATFGFLKMVFRIAKIKNSHSSTLWFWGANFPRSEITILNFRIQKSKFRILVDPISVFSTNFDTKFSYCRVYIITLFSRMSRRTRKFCSSNFSSTRRSQFGSWQNRKCFVRIFFKWSKLIWFWWFWTKFEI